MRTIAALAVLATGSWLWAAVGQAFPVSPPHPQADGAASAEAPAGTSPAWGKPIKTEIQPGQMVSFRSSNTEIQAYLVSPKSPPPTSPGTPTASTGAGATAAEDGEAVAKMPSVIYIHDIYGMTEFARSQAEALAGQGYVVLMPNLYSRIEGSEKGLNAQQAWVAYEKTPDRQAMQDLLAAVEYLHAEGKPTAEAPMAVVGHDMGGIYAMKLASADLRVTAAVNFYGRVVYANITPSRPVSPVEDLFNLRAPLLSFYGNQDPQVPKEQVQALESRLAHNPHRTYYEVIKLPSVGHGFLVPGRQGFNAQAAASAAEKVRDFLARYLRAEPPKDEL